MNDTVIRLLKMQLKNIKNVGKGTIEMPNYHNSCFKEDKAEVLGIYGQNGSGKTAVIDALSFLKNLMAGLSLPKDAMNYIEKNSDSAVIDFQFYIKHNEDEYIVGYLYELGKIIRIDNDGVKKYMTKLIREKLTVAGINDDGKPVGKLTLMDVTDTQKSLFSPRIRAKQLINNSKDDEIDLIVIKRVCERETRSFIFANEVEEYVSSAAQRDKIWGIVTALKRYALRQFYVINQGHDAVISLDFALPILSQYLEDNQMPVGDMLISLAEPSVFEKEQYKVFVKIVTDINKVLAAMIPGLSISVKEYGPQATPDGKEGIRFEVMSKRGSSEFPLRYESEGIKKIISLLNIITLMYNNPSVFLAVDELDAGVFEFLLGELIRVINETGRGQMLFTSHNLRPLEMLDVTSMLFTTSNHDNRYYRFNEKQSSNNLRETYIRALKLGGEKEAVCSKTLRSDIRQALYNAGEGLDE